MRCAFRGKLNVKIGSMTIDARVTNWDGNGRCTWEQRRERLYARWNMSAWLCPVAPPPDEDGRFYECGPEIYLHRPRPRQLGRAMSHMCRCIFWRNITRSAEHSRRLHLTLDSWRGTLRGARPLRSTVPGVSSRCFRSLDPAGRVDGWQ